MKLRYRPGVFAPGPLRVETELESNIMINLFQHGSEEKARGIPHLQCILN